MATIRQGYLDDYSQQNGNVGIGTSLSNEKFEIIGETTSQDLNVTGVSTFTYVSGSIKKHTDYAENVNITAGDVVPPIISNFSFDIEVPIPTLPFCCE